MGLNAKIRFFGKKKIKDNFKKLLRKKWVQENLVRISRRKTQA